jgi:hypothetical protein
MKQLVLVAVCRDGGSELYEHKSSGDMYFLNNRIGDKENNGKLFTGGLNSKNRELAEGHYCLIEVTPRDKQPKYIFQ